MKHNRFHSQSRFRSAPARPKRGWRGLKVVVSLAVVAVLLGGLLWQGFFLFQRLDQPIALVRVEGELRNSDPEVLEEILEPLITDGFLRLDLVAIRAALEEDPWVAAARVSRQWPDTLVVHIEEEVPIARWGDSGFLNRHGETLEVGNLEGLEALPRLLGPDGEARRVMQQYHEVSVLLRPTRLRVSEFRRDQRGAWYVRLDEGVEIVLGRGDVLDKMRRFLVVYDHVLRDHFTAVAAVDARYPQGVAVRWKEPVEAGT